MKKDDREELSRRISFAIIGGLTGALVSYLFSPTFLGKRVTLTQWFLEGLSKGDSVGTIFVCTAAGAVLGVALEVVLSRRGR